MSKRPSHQQNPDDRVKPFNGDRDRVVLRLIVIEGLVNFLVVLVKFIVGLSAGSIAILADAIHSLTDLANNFVAWFVLRVSSAPPDREHPYGHRKFETLAVFGLATLLSVMAIEVLLHAIRTRDNDVAGTPLELGIMIGVLFINTALAAWQRLWANRVDSDILRADASHTFSDVLTTIVVIVGWQLSVNGHAWLDRLCAIGVAFLVFRLAIDLFKRAAPILVDSYALAPEKIASAAAKIPGVRAVSGVRSRKVGHDTYVDLVISVDGSLDTVEAHKIADKVEQTLRDTCNVYDTSVHIEPFQAPEEAS